MIKVKRLFGKFNTNTPSDMEEYGRIINDTLCTITSKELEKEKSQEYSDEGKLISSRELIYFLVHWEEKVL